MSTVIASSASRDTRAMGMASAGAATLDGLVFNPLNVIRSRQQVTIARASVLQVARLLTPRDLGRGLVPALSSLVPRRVWAYTAHHALMKHSPLAQAENPVLRAALAGALVGAGEGFLFTPTRRVTAMQQVRSTQGAARTGAMVAAIYRQEGVRGLWRGVSLNMTRTGLSGCVYFGAIGLTAHLVPNSSKAVQGGVAAATGALLLNPMDVVLTRTYANPGVRVGWPRVLGDLLQNEGPKALFKGSLASIMRAAPSAAFNYSVTQALYHQLQPLI